MDYTAKLLVLALQSTKKYMYFKVLFFFNTGYVHHDVPVLAITPYGTQVLKYTINSRYMYFEICTYPIIVNLVRILRTTAQATRYR